MSSAKYVAGTFCELWSEYGGVLTAVDDATVIIYPSAMSFNSLAMSYAITMLQNKVIAVQSCTNLEK